MPFGWPASTDEIAAMVVFLTSDLSGYTSGTSSPSTAGSPTEARYR